jgi:SAM-dependent methyltransferase
MSRVLEVGCGTDGANKFNPKTPDVGNTVFLDVDKPEREFNFFVRGDAQRLPFRESLFRSVYASHVIEHLDNPKLFLTEVRRVMASGGRIYVWCPNFCGRTAKTALGHKHVFTYFSLRSLMVEVGFKTLMIMDFCLLNFRFFPLRAARLLGILTVDELRAEGTL